MPLMGRRNRGDILGKRKEVIEFLFYSLPDDELKLAASFSIWNCKWVFRVSGHGTFAFSSRDYHDRDRWANTKRRVSRGSD
jgi:hypothetical protein